MNRTNTQPGGRKQPVRKTGAANKQIKRKQAPTKRVPVQNRSNKNTAKQRETKKRDSLVPLLIILIILLSITLFLTFSEQSDFLSGLFSRDSASQPEIERPEIVKTEVTRPETAEEDSFAVTTEVEINTDEEESESQETEMPEEKSIKSRLFFVKVSDEGQISLKSIIRSVSYQARPLEETIKSLMRGPDRSDLNKGMLNLIPQDTELLSVSISGGTAFLDFNENFRYNTLGFEGYKAQLMQIIYTATEFSSVESVQILINGEMYDYLGAEGVYIGEPITRDYFNTF